MRFQLALLACLGLAGCTAVDGPAFDGGGPAYVPSAGILPDSYRRPVSRTCENYADQTYRNTYENLSDTGESFGVGAFNRQRAERAGDDAYARCRAGRLS